MKTHHHREEAVECSNATKDIKLEYKIPIILEGDKRSPESNTPKDNDVADII